jgi:hypothetical protein
MPAEQPNKVLGVVNKFLRIRIINIHISSGEESNLVNSRFAIGIVGAAAFLFTLLILINRLPN